LIQRINNIIFEIEFEIDKEYSFHVKEGHGGVYLFATYWDKDIYTRHPEEQHTRKWLISPKMTDSEIVQTAFKLCITSMEHRTREAFKYKGARIFGPHFDVEDLVKLCKNGHEDAGGRKE
jgi:hypothetical protein